MSKRKRSDKLPPAPTPLAHFLRALGGGKLSPDFWKRIPRSVIPCTDPTGPDFDLPIRFAFNDLTPEELASYQTHIAECKFCRDMCEQVKNQDNSKFRAVLKQMGIDLSDQVS